MTQARPALLTYLPLSLALLACGGGQLGADSQKGPHGDAQASAPAIDGGDSKAPHASQNDAEAATGPDAHAADGSMSDAGRPIDEEALRLVLAEIRAGSRYHKPTPQDAASPGIYPDGAPDASSEPVLPPFIMAPRRQTDSMVRQLYSLLPRSIRRSIAFVIPDRIAKDPDAYVPYLRSREAVVIVGNFVGIGQASADQAWFVDRHATELWMASITLRLAQALRLEIQGVRYTMGDSTSAYASQVREDLETKLHAELSRLGLAEQKLPVTWGADEAVPVALAATLPERTIRVRYASTTARHHYDGNKTSPEVVVPKLGELGLKQVDSEADLELVVLNNVTGDDGTFPNATSQHTFDEDTFGWVRSLDAAARQKLVIVDGRMFNGSFDAYSAPPYCDYLGYGAWGTFANKVGTTLASAKIALASNNVAARRALLLEAIAHDAFANGYRDGRDLLKPRLSARGITFDHSGGYESIADVTTVFEVLNQLVQERMQAHFKGSDCLGAGEQVRFTPQLWRTFESEAHLTPTPKGAPGVVGAYRSDLAPAVFDPRNAGASLRALTLDDLLLE